MKIIDANSSTVLALGRCGENLARKVLFDITDFESLYGVGTVEILYQRPNDAQPYPLAVQRDGTSIVWNVTSTDTAIPNAFGKCELRYYSGETLVKSRIWQTWVDNALSTPSETTPPGPEQGWVDKVLEAGQAAVNASVNSPKIGNNGNWFVWDFEAGAYVDTGVAASGGGSGLPATSTEDAGKVLTVTEAGVPGWADSGLADKLPKSPANWEPWTAEEQAAARERIGIPGNYELIEEINLEEDTTIIERNTDLQGNAYNFKAIRILYEIAKGAGTGYIRTRLQENNESNGSFIPYGIAIETNKSVSICGCELVNGFPVSFGLYRASAITGVAVQGAYSPSCYFPTRGEAVNAINSLYINSVTSGVPIPSGSKIKIYGARA